MHRSRTSLAALTLAVDADTAYVVQALCRGGVEPILLKGPVLGRLLYPGELRPYFDIDLLVGPDDTPRAEQILRELGYVRGLTPLPPQSPNATSWTHTSRRSVDLHRSMHFVNAPLKHVWDVVRRDAATIEVAGTPVLSPGMGVIALHLCLHAAMSGDVVPKTVNDLERGVTTLPLAVWKEALVVAAELDAVDAFGGGLALCPAGIRLAREVGLPSGGTKAMRMRRVTTPYARPWTIELLIRQPSVRAAAYAIVRRCFPARGHIHLPGNRRGPGWLALAYAMRLGSMASKVPGSVVAWGYVWWQGRHGGGGQDPTQR